MTVLQREKKKKKDGMSCIASGGSMPPPRWAGQRRSVPRQGREEGGGRVVLLHTKLEGERQGEEKSLSLRRKGGFKRNSRRGRGPRRRRVVKVSVAVSSSSLGRTAGQVGSSGPNVVPRQTCPQHAQPCLAQCPHHAPRPWCACHGRLPICGGRLVPTDMAVGCWQRTPTCCVV